MFKPNLVPRFNLDYNIFDFYRGMSSIFKKKIDEKSSLTTIFGRKHFFTNSGRTSLYVILKALNIPKNSRIGVPLYSCPSVFDAIIQAGHRPCFIDIDFGNYTLDLADLEKKSTDISALIVIHTFGIPAKMDEILDVAKNIPVIEDCAHSLLSRYKGRLTGTIGDASIFSFRSGKYISAGEGGMVVVNNEDIGEDVQKEIENLSEATLSNEIKHTAFVYIKSMLYHRPWYGMFARDLGVRLDEKVNISGKRGFKTEKIKKSDLAVFLRKFSVFEALVERQRKNSILLIEELRNTDLILPHEEKNAYFNYYLFPVLFNTSEARDSAHERLKKLGIDTAKLFSETPEEARRSYGYKGDCPNTEEIGKRILILPNFYTLNEHQILEIAEKVKEVV